MSGTACCALVSNPFVPRFSVAVAFLCASGIMLCQSHLASSANPSRHVAVFEVHDRNMIDALLLFGQQSTLALESTTSTRLPSNSELPFSFAPQPLPMFWIPSRTVSDIAGPPMVGWSGSPTPEQWSAAVIC